MPFAIPIIIGLTAASTAVSATGQIKAGNAAKRSGEAAAQREEYNARIAETSAQDALARGREEESDFRTQVRQLIGSQRASFAAQGLDVGSGSAAQVQGDTAYLGELDAQRIRANAAREAWGFDVEAHDRRLAARYSRASGQAAQSASRWGAGSTVLSGASSALTMKYGWDRGR